VRWNARIQAQLDSVLQVFQEFKGGPVYHLLGNHCLYNLSRSQLHPKLGLADPDGADHGVAYYDFSPHERFRFVMVDPYDISIMGWPEGHPRRVAAERFLKQHNPNSDLNSPVGLRGFRRRYVAFNGGAIRYDHHRWDSRSHLCVVSAALGDEQMKWLEGVLEDATAKGQRVVICTHVPLCPHNSTAYAVIWNYEEVMPAHDMITCTATTRADTYHDTPPYR
jgi:manganese-dependent ADP-ribose/CDP-alcohol diphosphatase